MIGLYGIGQCQACRRARRWLDAAGIDDHWVDIDAAPLTTERIAAWLERLGPGALINRRSRAWRQLDEAERRAVDAAPAAALAARSRLLKRPVLEAPGAVLAGFDPDRYRAALIDRGA